MIVVSLSVGWATLQLQCSGYAVGLPWPTSSTANAIWSRSMSGVRRTPLVINIAHVPRWLRRLRDMPAISPCPIARIGRSFPEAHAEPLGGLTQWSILAAQQEFSSLRQLEVGGVIHRQLVSGSQL
jgi:hypothetical protein